MRDVLDFDMVDDLREQVARERDRAETWLARAVSAELLAAAAETAAAERDAARAEAAAAWQLLERWHEWYWELQGLPGTTEPVIAATDAALAARAQPPAKTAGTGAGE